MSITRFEIETNAPLLNEGQSSDAEIKNSCLYIAEHDLEQKDAPVHENGKYYFSIRDTIIPTKMSKISKIIYMDNRVSEEELPDDEDQNVSANTPTLLTVVEPSHEIVNPELALQQPQADPSEDLASPSLGFTFLLTKLWSIAFIGILLHDYILFERNPENQYGNTLGDLFGGLPLAHPENNQFGRVKTNQNIWLNHLGSDKVTDIAPYWLPTIAALSSPLIDTVFLFSSGCSRTQHMANKGFYRYVFNPLAYGSMPYAYIRYSALFAQKTKESMIHHENENDCGRRKMTYTYDDSIADYRCSIFGEWDGINISVKDASDLQRCLNALLSAGSSPENILDGLDTLKKFSGYHVVDMTNVDWQNWNDAIFEKIIYKLTEMNLKLDMFDLSSKSFDASNLSKRKIVAINSFMQSTIIDTFQMKKRALSADLSEALFKALQNSTYRNFVLTDTSLGDVGANFLGTSGINIGNLEVSNSGLTDLSIPQLFSGAQCVSSVGVEQNAITDVALKNIADSKCANEIKEINLSFVNEITSTGLRDLEKFVSLEAIVMSANDFDEDEVLTFSQSLAPSLKKIVFSRMDLSSDYAADIFFENIPKNIEHLDISYDQIKANGVTAAANFLLKSNVTTFIAAGNNFTVSEFTELLQAIFDSFVIQLDISDSMLSDEHIHILINFLEKYKNRLVGIKLDMNKIKDESGCRLVAALSAAGVREFSIENNLLTNKFGFELADVIPRSNFTKVNMSSNLMDGDSISAILKAGKLINLAANNMPISDENIVAISKDLIKSPYDLSYVSNDELSIDQKRALHQATPNHEVEVLSLNNCGITDNAKKILLRVLPYTNIESNNVVMHQFQQTESKTPTLFKLRRHGLFSEKNKQYSQEQPINHIAVGIR